MSTETPRPNETPAHRDPDPEAPAHREADEEAPAKEPDEGQVSEVGQLPAHDERPIAPEDATAGSPSDESGRVEEGGVGPDASPYERRHRD